MSFSLYAMMWNIIHKSVTASTNNDARAGKHGDVFTADFQTAGRGRLDHKWLSQEGENLMMSVVLDVSSLSIAHASTLPLVAGLAVVHAVEKLLVLDGGVWLKWPNDVYVSGKKICGILCERCGDNVIVWIGVNVKQRVFPDEISARATSLALHGVGHEICKVRDFVLASLEDVYQLWLEGALESVYHEISRVDMLKGLTVRVVQNDSDCAPVDGLCGGIALNGSLIVDNMNVWAGEARVFTDASLN